LRHLRQEIGARSGVLIGAIVLDLIVVTGFIWINISGDLLVVGIACVLMLAILTVEVLDLATVFRTHFQAATRSADS
jgi:ABC-type transport system involved in Fe-S cluster assembly fused permease/ATPase subunit